MLSVVELAASEDGRKRGNVEREEETREQKEGNEL